MSSYHHRQSPSYAEVEAAMADPARDQQQDDAAPLAAAAKPKPTKNYVSGKGQKKKSYPIPHKVKVVRKYRRENWKNAAGFTRVYNASRNEDPDKINEHVLKRWIKDEFLINLADASDDTTMLNDNRVKRRKPHYDVVEKRLVDHIRLRESRLSSQHGGRAAMPIEDMKRMAHKFAEQHLSPEKRRTFQASNGWISNVVKRNRLRSPGFTVDDAVVIDAPVRAAGVAHRRGEKVDDDEIDDDASFQPPFEIDDDEQKQPATVAVGTRDMKALATELNMLHQVRKRLYQDLESELSISSKRFRDDLEESLEKVKSRIRTIEGSY